MYKAKNILTLLILLIPLLNSCHSSKMLNIEKFNPRGYLRARVLGVITKSGKFIEFNKKPKPMVIDKAVIAYVKDGYKENKVVRIPFDEIKKIWFKKSDDLKILLRSIGITSIALITWGLINMDM
ncbi:MAG: hypothetical protein ABFR36_01395 [Acidobacteriota bacterium]